MSDERFRQLLRWTDQKKWPRWEMVMYVNRISVEEAKEFLSRLFVVKTWDHVKRGIEHYTGANHRAE